MSGLQRVHRDDRGLAAVEFAFMLPILGLVVFATIPLILLLIAGGNLSQATSEGARFATKARPNPITSPDFCPGLTRRHTLTQIESRTRSAADGLLGTMAAPQGTVAIYLQAAPTPAVPNPPKVLGGDPCTAVPGSWIIIETVVTQSTGPAASIAHAFASLISPTGLSIPTTIDLSSEATGVLE